MPWYNSGAGWLGKLARFDLASFSISTTEVLDLKATDSYLTTFGGGFTDGRRPRIERRTFPSRSLARALPLVAMI